MGSIKYVAILALALAPSSWAAARSPVADETDQGQTGWSTVPAILARIQAPHFPAREFKLCDFGAVADGKSDCKSALDQAMAACASAGGGRVVVTRGEWLVNGPIHLKSGVNLHLEAGAVVRFGPEPKFYLPVVFTRYEGNELMNYSPFLYAYEQDNIAITGEGTFDGQASKTAWWPWKEAGSADQARIREISEGSTLARERVFGGDHSLRTNFVQPYSCKNVLIEGVTFTNSPMWTLNPVLCSNVTIRNVKVSSHGPNNDGCDPDSCRDVLIEGCVFDTGDDCIAIKSGRNADGRRIGVPSENIIIRKCRMKDGHGGVVLGSEMSGGIRNVFVEDCVMDSPSLERAIRLKSNTMRGGYLQNLFVRNVKVGQVADAVIRINLNYDKDRGTQVPEVRNIFIEGVTSERSKYPLYLAGLSDSKIRNIVLDNCTFKNAERPSVIENVEELTLRNFRLLPKAGIDNK